MSLFETVRPGETEPGEVQYWGRLLDEARHGQETSSGTLLDRCRAYLLRIANQEIPHRLQSLVSPSDAVQETFLAAHRRLETFRGATEQEFARWMRTILINCIRRKASLHRRRGSIERSGKIESLAALDKLEEHRWRQNSLALNGSLVNEERQQAILLALASLPDHYRVVIEMRNLGRKSFQEIGTSLGRSPEATRKLWIRALAMIREKLRGIDDQSRT